MKHIQDSYLTGYVKILVKGDKPELFFQACMDEEIVVWNVKKLSVNHCEGNIKLSDINIIKKVRRGSNYKVTFISKRGYPFLIRRIIKRKEVLLSILISLLLITFLSNILWKVTITGVSKEMEEKINQQLTSYGIHPGSFIFSLDSPSSIQQELAKDLPELLWVGVHKKGTTFYLEGVEKTIVKKEEIIGPRHLVATKKGVIKSIYVSKGLSLVNVNDYVEPGDILVSGIINEEESQSDNEDIERKKPRNIVAAEAEIIANTWYEVSVTIPLTTNYELLTGKQASKHYLQIGSMQVPVWGFTKPEYQEVHLERVEKPLYFLKWRLPINMVESILSEKVYNKLDRTKEEAINSGIIQAKHDLQLRLGPEAQILSEKVLHETVENGKVNLNLYITVEENIARSEPIIQGD